MNPKTDPETAFHRRSKPGLTLLAGASCLLCLLGACEEKQDPNTLNQPGKASAPAETAAAPEPAPEPEREEPQDDRRASSGDALQGLELDPKVVFPQINEPSSKEVAVAVADLAAAIAGGDSRTLHQMLDTPNQVILDELVETGIWQESTETISNVRVCSLEEEGQSLRVGLGVEDDEGAYLLGWSGERVGASWLFSGIALDTPASANTAAELDGGSLAAREIPEPGAIIDDEFDPTVNDPRRDQNNRRRSRGSRRSGGGGGGPRGPR